MEEERVAPREVAEAVHIDCIVDKPRMPEMHDPCKVSRIVGNHQIQVLKTALIQIRTHCGEINLKYHQTPKFMHWVFENNIIGIEFAKQTPVCLLQILKVVFEFFQQAIIHGHFRSCVGLDYRLYTN